jgi:DHA1 family bicyclomycin/chloramphenicol resistance-like MFS transporter
MSDSATSGHAPHSHHHPGLRLALIVAALSMLAPFSIDTYLPSFPDIGRELSVSTWGLQQTLSLYLLAFGSMTLVYGPLSDAFGRRNVVLVSVVIYVAASVGCAIAPSFEWLLAMRIGEGLAASGGLVVGRAIIRDAFAGAQAQRVMSQVMLIFALAPAVAPILGGYLHDFYGWRSVFWFLVLLGLAIWVGVARWLPETLPPVGRQSPHPRAIAHAYARALAHGRFMLLVLITAFSFGGFFLYIAGSPDIMYRHLHYGADEFGYLFVPLVAGLMFGAFVSGRVAGRLSHAQAVSAGFVVMITAALMNLALTLAVSPTPLAIIAPVTLYAGGMSLAMPNLTLLALEYFPTHRGMASAVQSFAHTLSNAVAAGVLAPALSLTLPGLATGMLVLNAVGLLGWLGYRRVPAAVTAHAP